MAENECPHKIFPTSPSSGQRDLSASVGRNSCAVAEEEDAGLRYVLLPGASEVVRAAGCREAVLPKASPSSSSSQGLWTSRFQALPQLFVMWEM